MNCSWFLGESGKTTFFNQIRMSRSGGISYASRLAYGQWIVHRTIEDMQKLCKAALLPSMAWLMSSTNQLSNAMAFQQQIELLKAHLRSICSYDVHGSTTTYRGTLSPDFVNSAKLIWKHGVIQKVFTFRVRWHIPDSAQYFFDKLDEISTPDYVPSDQDILNLHFPTERMQYTQFDEAGASVCLVDVGGSPRQRKKWIQCFANVTVVIFVVALSEYDEM